MIPRRALWRLAAVALSIYALGRSPSRAEDAAALYLRAAAQQGMLRLAGVQVVENKGPHGQQWTVERRVLQAPVGKEFTEVLKGPPFLTGLKTICNGRLRYWVLPGGRTAWRSPDLGDPSERHEREVQFAREALKYSVVQLSGANEGVAGRSTYLLVFSFRGFDQKLYKIREVLLDRQNLAILENREYGMHGLRSRTYFRDIRFDTRLVSSAFEYRPGADVLVLPEPTGPPFPVGDDTRQRLGAFVEQPPVPAVPSGWSPTGCIMLHYGGLSVAQFGYYVRSRDRSAVLLRHRLGETDPFFGAFFRTAEATGRVKRLGSQFCVWRGGGYLHVLASPLPESELLAAARQFQSGLSRP
ncbi:MAG TPA: hypothetical protein PLD23_20210 [Armatimonadota bacterium]|nr:hypothetical protein [Armatimonadota bacterium]